MKKTTLKVLALILVIVAAVVVCSSCGKKEEAKEETISMKLTFINKTGETVKNLALKERIGSQKQAWETASMEDGAEVTLEIKTVAEKGAPDIDFSFATESGQAFQTLISEKGDKTITLKKDPEGGVAADIITK